MFDINAIPELAPPKATKLVEIRSEWYCVPDRVEVATMGEFKAKLAASITERILIWAYVVFDDRTEAEYRLNLKTMEWELETGI